MTTSFFLDSIMSKCEFLKAEKSLDPLVFHTAEAWGLQPKIPISRLKLEHSFEEDSLFKIFKCYRSIVSLAYFHCYWGSHISTLALPSFPLDALVIPSMAETPPSPQSLTGCN